MGVVSNNDELLQAQKAEETPVDTAEETTADVPVQEGAGVEANGDAIASSEPTADTPKVEGETPSAE